MLSGGLLPFSFYPRLAPRSRWGLLAVAACVAVVNPTTNGYDASMMGSILALDQYKDKFSISPETSGLNNGSMFIGMFLAVPFVQYFSDYFGRKKAIFIGTSITIIAIIIMLTSNVIGQFIFGRVLYGFGSGISAGAAPTLVSELCPAHLRSRILGAYHSCYYVGALLASGVTFGSRNINGDWSWRLPILVLIAPTLLCIASLYFCPESPRWLVMNRMMMPARDVWLSLENGDEVITEASVREVSKSISAELSIYSDSSAWKEMFSSKANLRRILIMCSLGLMTELSGSSIGTFYFTTILEQAGVKDSSTQLQVGIIRFVYCLFWSVVGCMTFDLFGRKPQALMSMLGIIISMFLLGALVKLYGTSDRNSGQYAAIAMMFISGGAYSWCFTPLMCIYPAEIFPNRTRALGAACFLFFDNAAGIFSTFMLPIGMSTMNYKFYMLTGAYDILFLPLIQWLWVETKKVPLEEVANLFGDGEEAATDKAIDECSIIVEGSPVKNSVSISKKDFESL